MYFITIQSLQDVFLMFELILRLFGLFSPLLFLNHSECVLGGWLFLLCHLLIQVLAVRLGSTLGLRRSLVFALIHSLRHILFMHVLLTSDAESLLDISLVLNVHALTLVW